MYKTAFNNIPLYKKEESWFLQSAHLRLVKILLSLEKENQISN